MERRRLRRHFVAIEIDGSFEAVRNHLSHGRWRALRNHSLIYEKLKDNSSASAKFTLEWACSCVANRRCGFLLKAKFRAGLWQLFQFGSHNHQSAPLSKGLDSRTKAFIDAEYRNNPECDYTIVCNRAWKSKLICTTDQVQSRLRYLRDLSSVTYDGTLNGYVSLVQNLCSSVEANFDDDKPLYKYFAGNLGRCDVVFTTQRLLAALLSRKDKVYLDGTFHVYGLKTHEKLITCSVIDGGNRYFTVCFAICATEDRRAYENLRDAIRQWCPEWLPRFVVADGLNYIKSVFSPSAHRIMCAWHLLMTLLAHIPGGDRAKKQFMDDFSTLRRCVLKLEFELCLSEFRDKYPRVFPTFDSYLSGPNSELGVWCRSQVESSDKFTLSFVNNVAEGGNKVIKESMKRSPTGLMNKLKYFVCVFLVGQSSRLAPGEKRVCETSLKVIFF